MLVALATVGLVAVSLAAFGTGRYAAVGDGTDGPGALMAEWVGAQQDSVETSDGSIAGRADDTGAPDATNDRRPIPGSATPQPPASTPTPTPAPTPAPDRRPQPTQPPTFEGPTDPMSAEYNPYATPGDPAFVSDDVKSGWLAREAVIRDCMADAGFSYLEWQWWYGGSPQPGGMNDEQLAAWSAALRGDPASGDWRNSGCRGVAQNAVDEAEAAGEPLRAEIPPPPGPEVPTERERWLDFQDAVRGCMTDAGFEYRYWEYWNPAYTSDGGSPAMPGGLDDPTAAAWHQAAFGTADLGAPPRLDGSGCWAIGAAASGWSVFEQ